MAGIIHHTPGESLLSESSHYSAFSAWQAAKSLELLCVTILPFVEWDIKIFTWGMGHGVPSINVCDVLWAIWARGTPEMGDPSGHSGGIWDFSEVLSLLCRIKEMVWVINYSSWAVSVLKAQHEFPARFRSHNHSYAPILLGSEMELWLNEWNLFLVLFLITVLFLFLWCALEEGLERKEKEGGQGNRLPRVFFFFHFSPLFLFLFCFWTACSQQSRGL